MRDFIIRHKQVIACGMVIALAIAAGFVCGTVDAQGGPLDALPANAQLIGDEHQQLSMLQDAVILGPLVADYDCGYLWRGRTYSCWTYGEAALDLTFGTPWNFLFFDVPELDSFKQHDYYVAYAGTPFGTAVYVSGPRTMRLTDGAWCGTGNHAWMVDVGVGQP